MVHRRAAFNPLEPTASPRWYVVRSMHGTVLESRRIDPGTDLKRAFITTMLEWMDAGWQLGEFSSVTGTFFCDRRPERRMVSIDPTDPYDVPAGAARLGGCPTCGD
jgi:hypothetical protein